MKPLTMPHYEFYTCVHDQVRFNIETFVEGHLRSHILHVLPSMLRSLTEIGTEIE